LILKLKAESKKQKASWCLVEKFVPAS